MEFKISVLLDVTPRLEKLARTIFGATSSDSRRKIPAQEPPEPPEPPKPAPETEAKPAQEPQAPPQPEPMPEAMPEPEAAQQDEPGSDIPDDETMRTLMDIAISKWAGVGSENSKDPKVLRDRKDICNAFKQIARHLGSEKPTKLQGEDRNKFLHEIENNLYREGDKIEWRAF